MRTHLIPIAALMLIPAWARADEPVDYRPSAKDQGAAVYSYQVKPARGGGEFSCHPAFSKAECRRMRAEIAKRETSRTRIQKARSSRYDDEARYRDYEDRPRPRREKRIYVETEDSPALRRRCGEVVIATGSQRPFTGMAEESARKAWARQVRFTLGETYLSWENARGKSVKCVKSSIGGALQRCVAAGIPCRL